MSRVMMRCPYNWTQEIFTGIDIPRKGALAGFGNKVVECPICKNHHYLRRLYFEGDPVTPAETDVYALDVAYGFAGEVGVLISVMALIEDYLAMLLAKLTGADGNDARITMGTFYNFSHRVDLLEHLAQQESKDSELRKDILSFVKKIREANNARVKYAHAKYSVGAELKVHVEPFYGDARKKKKTIVMAVDDVARDVELVKAVSRELHGFLYRGERPKR